MEPNGCKQVTTADIESGWHFSGPLADQIRRRKISAASQQDWTQSGADGPAFGASDRAFERLRFRGSWKRRKPSGWSAKAIVTWYCLTTDRERKEQEGWAIGCPKWWQDHQP